MNLSRDPAPPVNNALLPDIYSKLDAETLEKTRVANTVLNIRLKVEQKVINKYRREAERMLKSQRENAVADLSRIAQKLPSTLAEPRLDSHTLQTNRCQKGYLMGRNEETICHRCYIHHLPTKKKYYVDEPDTPPPRLLGSTLHQVPEGLVPVLEKSGNTSASSRPAGWEAGRTTSEIKYEISKDKVIAPIEKYKFLDRDLCGRDRDLNDTITPRLVPYEQWKTVVKNVCSQCKREIKVMSKSPLSRPSGFSRENTNISREFTKTRRSSRSTSNTPLESVATLSRTSSMFREASNLSRGKTRKTPGHEAQDYAGSMDRANSQSSLRKDNSRSNSRALRKHSGLGNKIANGRDTTLHFSQLEKLTRRSPTTGFHSKKARSTSTSSMHKE